MRPLPIRLRLTLWYCAMFAAAAVLLSVSSWWMLRRSLMATEYHELQERAEDVQLLLRQLGPDASLQSLAAEVRRNLPGERRWQISTGARSGRAMDLSFQTHDRCRAAARRSWRFCRRMARSDEFHQGTRYVRVLAYPIHANGRAYSVQTGIALNKSMVLLSAFGARLLLLTPAVLILAAIGGHFMSRKALAPVAAIAAEARRINDRNLDIRLPIAPTRDEISDLSETLNQMLQRVESGVRSTRDFTANAAHELRTPLALIRTEVEVALSRIAFCGRVSRGLRERPAGNDPHDRSDRQPADAGACGCGQRSTLLRAHRSQQDGSPVGRKMEDFHATGASQLRGGTSAGVAVYLGDSE